MGQGKTDAGRWPEGSPSEGPHHGACSEGLLTGQRKRWPPSCHSPRGPAPALTIPPASSSPWSRPRHSWVSTSVASSPPSAGLQPQSPCFSPVSSWAWFLPPGNAHPTLRSHLLQEACQGAPQTQPLYELSPHPVLSSHAPWSVLTATLGTANTHVPSSQGSTQETSGEWEGEVGRAWTPSSKLPRPPTSLPTLSNSSQDSQFLGFLMGTYSCSSQHAGAKQAGPWGTQGAPPVSRVGPLGGRQDPQI